MTNSRDTLNTRVANTKPTMQAYGWQQSGNCAGTDTEMFFLDTNERQGAKQKAEARAKAVCVGCPVVAECLTHALSVPENYGVWGGTTPEERKTLRRNLNRKSRLEITKES